MNNQRMALVILVLTLSAVLAPSALRSEPPVERVLVVAVADADGDRVLVRWRTLEGTRRYTNYHVMRRHSDDTAWTRLNVEPIAPLSDVASIEAVFNAPGRADALAWIQQTFGAAYAGELLRIQSDDAENEALAQRIFLPDQNYGAALAMGQGFLDESVVSGETYVYELWGADGAGFAVERLGRASATAGEPGLLSAPLELDCAEMTDQKSHGAAYMRWTGPDDEHWLFGYEVLRAPRLPNDSCPPMTPGAPGVVKANGYPILPGRAGAVSAGGELFVQHCQSCHAAPDPRGAPPDPTPALSGVKGGTLRAFRQRMNSNVTGLASYPHETAALEALSSEKLEKVFDWVQEFIFRDDGDDTPLDPVDVGETYCYQVYPRDLLGQLITASDVEQCEVEDNMPPDVPAAIFSERVQVGNYEICRISWDSNDELVDGTQDYEVLRVRPDVPRNAYIDPSMVLISVSHPGAGQQVVFDDTSLTIADAASRLFYAVRARDGSGNTSPATAWVPCVPRDIQPPPPPEIYRMDCCAIPEVPGSCGNTAEIPGWLAEGGDDTLFAEPRFCKPRLGFEGPGDTYGWRVYRSFDGTTFHQVAEVTDPWYDVEFQPTLDQKVWFRVKGYDSSGNLSESSETEDLFLLGSIKPPAPKILNAVHAIHGEDSYIKITFRSMPPRAVLGFAFYKQHFNPDNPFGYYFVDPPLMVRYHDNNLGPNRLPGQERWAVLPGATTLDNLGVMTQPDPGGPYLYFDELLNRWEMQVPMEEYETANLVITLRTIGWTGYEGAGSNFHWDGWSVGDLELDWPDMPDDNFIGADPGVNDLLNVYHHSTYNRLNWTAYPDGCDGGYGRPFVIYRRRGNSPVWKQISPLFSCDDNAGTGPVIDYQDHDVEDGFNYTYIVVRFDRFGEFAHRMGPASLCRNCP